MQRMSLSKFCKIYGASYYDMLNYCQRGLLPHSGGGKRGCPIRVWDEDVIAFLRDQDQRQAELKAASMKNMQQAANIISFRKNKPSVKTDLKAIFLILKVKLKSFWQSVELLHNREG